MSGEEAARREVGWGSLLHASLLATIYEVAGPAGQVVVTVTLAHGRRHDPDHNTANLAAYAAVESTVQFAEGLFNFLLVVVMARVGHAAGARQWGQVSRLVVVSAAAACIVGSLCTAALHLVRGDVLRLLALDNQVLHLASGYYSLRILCSPLSMLCKWGAGVLAGHQRVSQVAAISVAGSAVLAVGTAVAVFEMRWGLVGAGWAALAAQALQAAFYVGGVAHLLSRRAPQDACEDSRSTTRFPDSQPIADPLPFSICTFLQDSGNMMVRSMCLQLSLYALSVCASQNGRHFLAAHQVITQLWLVLSYICDGFADVGTMKGSRMLGENRFGLVRLMSRRLLIAGLVTGVGAAMLMLVAEQQIIQAFAGQTSASTIAALHQVWPLIACLQPINAMVFVYDGLLMATRSFAYVRNVFLIGVPFLYIPVLLYGNARYHSLLAIWGAKGCLNVWRFLTSMWRINIQLDAEWRCAELKHDTCAQQVEMETCTLLDKEDPASEEPYPVGNCEQTYESEDGTEFSV